MKSFVQLSLYSVPPTLAGLFSGATIIGVGIGLASLLTPEVSFPNFVTAWSIGLYMSMFAVMLGLLPALLYGTTAYALLLRFGRANYLTAAILGCIPGLAILVLDSSFGVLFLAYGIAVACCTHFFAKRSIPLRAFGAN